MPFRTPVPLSTRTSGHPGRSFSHPDHLPAALRRAKGFTTCPLSSPDDNALEECSLPSTRDGAPEDETFESTGKDPLEHEPCIDLTGDDAPDDKLSGLAAYSSLMVLDFARPAPVRERANCRGVQHSGTEEATTGTRVVHPGQDPTGAPGSPKNERHAPPERSTIPASETTLSFGEEETQSLIRRFCSPQPSVTRSLDSTQNRAVVSAKANMS